MHPLAASDPDPRYPVGRWSDGEASRETLSRSIQHIATLPGSLSSAVVGLSVAQLDTAYRDGGWTLRQLLHHVADSHLNAYTRLRLALTEDWPLIKPYLQDRWAELPDARTLPVEHSLALLVPLHTRWTTLLHSLDQAEWQRGYKHPESGPTTIRTMTAMYSWHGRHHTAHVLALRSSKGW